MSQKKLGSIIEAQGDGVRNEHSVFADTRDVDFLRAKFFQDYRADTNDILTLFSYWQNNFQNFVQPPKILSQQVTEIATSPNLD
jgi:hypothetical protein